MIHYNCEDWTKYVSGQTAEMKQKELENHLYTCDQCLQLYLEALENVNDLPKMTTSSFADEIIASLPFEKKKDKPKTIKRRFYHHVIFHYGMAAAITFILMATGVFHSLTGYVQAVETKPALHQHKEAVSQSLMEKALSLIDTMEPQKKEGK